jgi:hypothetical protein
VNDAERREQIIECSKRINAAYDRIRQARLDAGIAPGEPMLWPEGLPVTDVEAL